MTEIQIPTNCPCCGSTLDRVNDQLFCVNTSCSAQLNKKLEHFCKVLGIKGMGTKTIESLQLSDIAEIYYLDQDAIQAATGSARIAEKLKTEIDRSRSADLAKVLASFSIPLVGTTAATKICSVVSHIDQIDQETCKAAQLGNKVTQNLLTWIQTDFQELREFLPFSFSSQQVSNNTDMEIVCITGKLSSYKTKAEAYRALEEAGYKVSESVTKATNILVDEDNKGSSKRQKAEQLGLKIITNLKSFLEENK